MTDPTAPTLATITAEAIKKAGYTTGTVANTTNITAGTITTDINLLDAAISSRMATYTQPTGFLTATFPTGKE